MKPFKPTIVLTYIPAVVSYALLRARMVQNTPVLPKLGLHLLNDAALDDYAAFILSQIIINGASFPALTPDETTLANALDNYHSKLVASKTGSKQAISAKNDTRVTLEGILIYMANSCSEIADGNVTLFKLSGFEVRNKPTPSGTLPAPANFELTLGPVEGTLCAKFKPVKNSRFYDIYFGLWNTDPETWTDHIRTTSTRGCLISDLPSNTRYSARCRAVGTKGPGEWSAVSTVKTY